MYSGYLCKRNSPISPPQMQKVYCILWGTLLLDYDNEDDAKSSLSPKSSMELIGVSDWDGQGRVNKYPNGFLTVSHTGNTYYLSAMSALEREDWMLHIKSALECNFANTELLQYKPSKAIHKPPENKRNMTCHKSNLPFSSSQPVACRSCGYNFLPEYIQETISIVQISMEDAEKVCSNCRNAQMILIWLKSLNYMHATALHESTPSVLQSINRYKSSFRLRRKKSTRLEMAAKMYEEHLINQEEFEELRKVDRNFLREWALEESARLKQALDMLDNDLHTVIGMLLNPNATTESGNGSRRSYYELIRKVIELAEQEPDLADFYWMQILHTHLRLARHMTPSALARVDLLQQAILVIAARYPQIALKTAWALSAVCGDYVEKRVTPTQYAASMVLFLSLQTVVCGASPALSNEPQEGVLGTILIAAIHQKIDFKVELRILMRCRRRLLELQDQDDLLSKQDKLARIPGVEVIERSSSTSMSGAGGPSNPGGSHSSDDSNPVVITASGVGTGKYTRVKAIQLIDTPLPFPLLKEISTSQESGGYEDPYSSPSDPHNQSLNINTNSNNNNSNSGNNSNNSNNMVVNYVAGSSPNYPTNISLYQKHVKQPKKLLQVLRELGLEEENEYCIGADYIVAAPFPSYNISRKILSDQLDWFQKVTDIVDKLRFVDRPLRTERLREDLKRLNTFPNLLGYDPTTIAGEPRYKISRIIVEMCRVFRTKARAPSLIVCEVIRVDDDIEVEDLTQNASVLTGANTVHPLYHTHHPLLHVNTNTHTYAFIQTPMRTRSYTSGANSGNFLSSHSMNPNSSSGRGSSEESSSHTDLQLEEVDHILASGVKQAVEIIHRRDTKEVKDKDINNNSNNASSNLMLNMDVVKLPYPHSMSSPAMVEIGSGSVSGENSFRKPTSPSTETNTVLTPRRNLSDDNLIASTATSGNTSHRKLRGASGVTNTNTNQRPPRLPAQDFESLTVSNVKPLKSSRLAAHRKSGSHFVVQAASGSFQNLGLLDLPIPPIAPATGSINNYYHESDVLYANQSFGKYHKSKEVNSEVSVVDGRVGGSNSSNNNIGNRNNNEVEVEMVDKLSAALRQQVMFSEDDGDPDTPTLTENTPVSTTSTSVSVHGRPVTENIDDYTSNNTSYNNSDKNNNNNNTSYNKDEPEHQSNIAVSHTRGVSIVSTDSTVASEPASTQGDEVKSVENDAEAENPESEWTDVNATSDCEPSNTSQEEREVTSQLLDIDKPPSSQNKAEGEDNSSKSNSNSSGGNGGDGRGGEGPMRVMNRDIDDGLNDDYDNLDDDELDDDDDDEDIGPDISPMDAVSIVTAKVRSSARVLLEKGAITEEEYRMLLRSDAKYRELSSREESAVSASRLQKCFGESWETVKRRILGNSYGSPFHTGGVTDSTDSEKNTISSTISSINSRFPLRDLRSFIVKSNDDLRQEMCCMQLLELCAEIFHDVGLSNLLWLKTNRILSTGPSTGVVQVLPDTLSIDALKKTDDFISLPKYYERVYGTSPERLKNARTNFVMSFAAYSLVCYIFQIKDRHNGNILIDREGHIIHIDFGFLLGIAPGGNFSLETAPFKFTEEMVEIIGGIDSPLFAELVRAFTTGFLALQANAENIVSTLEMLATDSPFPCFVGKDRTQIIEKLRGRFRTDLNVTETVHYCMDLITLSYGHLGTRQYDTFQWFTNGIIP